MTTTKLTKISPTTMELVEAVKAHAAENYANGWDVVVETMDDEDIAERIGRVRTTEAAIKRVAQLVRVQVGARIDVLGASGEHTEEVKALIASTKPIRQKRAKTGLPAADRAIDAAKAAPAKASATPPKPRKKAEPKLTATERKAEMSTTPIARIMSDADAALIDGPNAGRARKSSATPKPKPEAKPTGRIMSEAGETPKRATKERVAVTLPVGYVVRWDNGAYDLAKRGDGATAESAAWLVICKIHGTTTTATNVKEGDVLGRRAGRAGWCSGCKASSL